MYLIFLVHLLVAIGLTLSIVLSQRQVLDGIRMMLLKRRSLLKLWRAHPSPACSMLLCVLVVDSALILSALFLRLPLFSRDRTFQ